MTPLSIVHIPRRFVRSEWGGTETVVLETSKRLIAHGHTCELLCPNVFGGPEREVMDTLPIHRTPYFYPYWGLKPEARRLLDKKGGNLFSFSLWRALRAYPKLDLVHLHTINRLGGIGRTEALRRGIPYVVSLHGGVFDVPKQEAESLTAPARGAFEWGKVLGWWVGARRVLDDAAAIICVGQSEQVLAQKHFPNKHVIHLPNGVDPGRFAQGDGAAFRAQHGIPQDAFVLLTIARIDPQKNQLLAVRALPKLAAIEPRLHLVLVGPATNEPYLETIRNTARELGVESRLTIVPGLAGGSADLANAYHSGDVFLLPSRHEPFGIVILEAWSAGRPVIASRVGGIPAFVGDGIEGILFDSDQEESLVRAFERLAQNPELARSIAKAGRSKAEREFGWDRLTTMLEDIYENALRSHSAARGAS